MTMEGQLSLGDTTVWNGATRPYAVCLGVGVDADHASGTGASGRFGLLA